MRITDLLHAKSKRFYLFILLLGLMNSLLNASLLILINYTISQQPLPLLPQYNWLLFVTVVTVSLLVNRLFHRYMVRLTVSLLYSFQLDMLQKLRKAPYEAFEKLGREKVYTAINDATTLGNVPEMFVNGFNACVTILCCLAYFFWMSLVGGAVVLALMAVLLTIYLMRNNALEAYVNQLRDLQNDYYSYLDDLLLGFKEVKMSAVKNDNLYRKYILQNRSLGQQLSIQTADQYLGNELLGNYSWYVVIGVTIFGLPALFSLDPMRTTTFLVTILYLMAPIATLITLVPFYTNAKIAFTRLTEFDRQVQARLVQEEDVQHQANGEPFQSLQFRSVHYAYKEPEGRQTFHLGPVDLEVKRGEIVFVVGGNGSGKSTFINLLTGLYKPQAGTIWLNGQSITDTNHSAYVGRISAILTDNYLFNRNYEDYELHSANPLLNDYVNLMQLNKILRINDESGSIDKHLSRGQQKRLALIYALLEDRDVLVLDEWAAEQDSRFRTYFYTTLLPHFKQAGKTIIAVTHDGEFHECADRIVTFGGGLILSDRPASRSQDQPAMQG